MDEERITELVRDTHRYCAEYLAKIGEDELLTAARRVVWARYYEGEDGWDRLKVAIGQLEDLVGRPEKEPG